jgi:hypothetical protein
VKVGRQDPWKPNGHTFSVVTESPTTASLP